MADEWHDSPTGSSDQAITRVILTTCILIVLAGWAIAGLVTSLNYALADSGTARADAPDWPIPYVMWLPLLGVVLTAVTAVAHAFHAAVGRNLAAVALLATVIAWIVALTALTG